MIFQADVKFRDFRRYVYLTARGHAEAQEQTREQLKAQLGYADSDFKILELASEVEKPHFLLGEIRSGTDIIGYDYNPIFFTAQPLFQHDELLHKR